MPKELSNLEQYKMLREEIIQHIREMYRTDFWGAAAIAALYSFLFNKVHSGNLMWFIPPFFLLIAGVRVLVIFKRMELIAKYLELIEEVTFNDPKVIGWQRYLNKEGHQKPPVRIAICIWVVVLVAAVGGSYYFYRYGAGSDAAKGEPSALAVEVPPASSGR
jgi:hypothetical protein